MKRSIIIFTALAAMSAITLSSYSSGPSGAGNVTGSSGNTCGATGSCHGPNNPNTSVSVALTDMANNQPVTNGKYTPGHQYKVDITGSNAANLPKFGFQATVVKAGGALGGSFSASQSGTHTASAGGLTVVEHNTPLAKTGGTYNASFSWTARAAGTGAVNMYVELNAVNADNNSTGDQPNGTHLTLSEQAAGIEEITQLAELKLYPNPAAYTLHIAAGRISGRYPAAILDITGRQQWSGTIDMQQGMAEIPVAQLAGGMYYLQVGSGLVRRQVSFVKY